jgi:hypothetical protein
LIHHQSSLGDLISKLEADEICELTGLPSVASTTLASLGPTVLTYGLATVVGTIWFAAQ